MASVAKREWEYRGRKKEAWVVRYQEGGKHRSKQFSKKKDADAYRDKLGGQLANGLHVAPSENLDINALADLFLNVQRQRHADGRIGRGRLVEIENGIKQAIRPHLGHVKCSALMPKHVEDFYNLLRHPTDGTKPLALATAKMRVGLLNFIFEFGLQRSYLKRNIVPQGRKLVGSIPETSIRTLTVDDVKRLLLTAGTRQHRQSYRGQLMMNIMVNLGAFCGLRFGEILGLRLENIDLEWRVLRVRHNLTRFGELKGPKTTSGIRNVPMPQHLRDLLETWLRLYYRGNPDGLVFLTETGKKFCQGSLRHSQWYDLLKRSGMFNEGKGGQIHFHALRHFAASWMIKTNVSLPDAASLLGHKTFDLTLQTYTHDVMGGSDRQDMLDNMVHRFNQLPDAAPILIAQELRTAH